MSVVPIPGLDFGVDIKLMKDIIEDINKFMVLIETSQFSW